MSVPQRDQSRITSASKFVEVNGHYMEHHYYTRYIGAKTEIWFFGVGLGDLACMQQMGDAFLEICDRGDDPELGRIMVSHGSTVTALQPYKGDLNIWHAWGDRPDWVEYYLSKVSIRPDLCLCISHGVQKHLEKYGFNTFYSPLAVGRFFKPLGLERKGLGYCGNPTKSKRQYAAVIDPIANRLDFEWHGRNPKDEWWTLPRLNEWYNTKQIVFGMSNEYNIDLAFMSNRVFETLASGTPFIYFKHSGFEETFGYNYPYQTECAEETQALIDIILEDYPVHLARFAKYSEDVLKNHNYVSRLERLFKWLTSSASPRS